MAMHGDKDPSDQESLQIMGDMSDQIETNTLDPDAVMSRFSFREPQLGTLAWFGIPYPSGVDSSLKAHTEGATATSTEITYDRTRRGNEVSEQLYLQRGDGVRTGSEEIRPVDVTFLRRIQDAFRKREK